VTSELELRKSLGKKSKSKKIQKLNTRLLNGGDAVAGGDEKHVNLRTADGGKISSVRSGDTVFHADLSAARGDRVVQCTHYTCTLLLYVSHSAGGRLREVYDYG